MTNDFLPDVVYICLEQDGGLRIVNNNDVGGAFGEPYIRANKPAEVDLDALKMPEPIFNSDYSEYRRGYERGKQLGWNDCIDHIATGKGGDEPAAPTQIDAGELERAVSEAKIITVYQGATDNKIHPHDVILVKSFGQAKLLLDAARAHLEKSKGGV